MKKSIVVLVGLAFAIAASSLADDADKAQPVRGTWSAVAEFDEDGKRKELKPDDARHFTFEFTADKLITKRKEFAVEGTYKVDATKNPKYIDLVRKVRGRDSLFKGIYAIDGDKLKFCIAGTGNERPKEFKAGDNIEFAVEMLRVKK